MTRRVVIVSISYDTRSVGSIPPPSGREVAETASNAAFALIADGYHPAFDVAIHEQEQS